MAWRLARVRLFEGRNFYIRYTPNFGLGIPWFKSRRTHRMRRIRMAYHHGIQMVEWRGARWVVSIQIFGKSRVNKESFDLNQRK